MVMDRFISLRADEAVPRWFPMTVVAQDPSVRVPVEGTEQRRILTAQVRVPADWLQPGPRSHRFQVVDYDATRNHLAPALNPFPGVRRADRRRHWTFKDPFEGIDGARIVTERAFHAQNVFAIAARTLGLFESALGRRVPWGFGAHQLYLVPHAFAEANAFYSDDDQALLFGYFDDADGTRIYACLSHDVVAHETTHAVLDGLRPRFEEPGLPDQNAFHEAFADIVALLSVFSVQEVVENLLGPATADGTIDAAAVAPERLRETALFGLAEQLGSALRPGQGGGLRRSVDLLRADERARAAASLEPHARGEVLVAAFMQTLHRMWTERLAKIVKGPSVDRAIVAEEGVKSALHLLTMAIRSIDYTPPLEFEFKDFLDAILVSDEQMAPDDEHNYRAALRDAFRAFDIVQPEGQMIDLTRHPPTYEHLNFESLRADPDEVFRFLWENAEILDLCRDFHTVVEDVRPAARVGPDGFITRETVATYVQTLNGTVMELEALAARPAYQRWSEGMPFTRPAGMRDGTEVQMWGGGAVIFDQFGRAKFHQTKPLLHWGRQTERLRYLFEQGLSDTRGRYGFSLGLSRGQRFALVHQPDGSAEEGW